MSALLAPYPKFGDGIGFHRVRAIAERLGIDLDAFSSGAAVITGSNGKGSTTAMLAAILQETGARVGRFTSPHLLKLNERFAIDGEEIDDAALAHHWRRVHEAAEDFLTGRDDKLGGFEFLFLIAADWFAAQRCGLTVWEAGIGGRYDPTRLVKPRRTAVVSLDLEHTLLLGASLEQIAFDKIDAAAEGATVYVGEDGAALRDRIETYCMLRALKPVFVDHRDILQGAPASLVLPLAGLHQRNNAAIAMALAADMAPSLGADSVARGLTNTRWPGRLEVISEAPLIVIDVGHTPAAIAAALDGFQRMIGAQEAVLVCGASVDKSADVMISALAPAFATIVATAAQHKGRPAAEIANVARAVHPRASVVVAETMAEARQRALSAAIERDAAIYVAGGLFLATEFKAVHQGLDPGGLAFF